MTDFSASLPIPFSAKQFKEQVRVSYLRVRKSALSGRVLGRLQARWRAGNPDPDRCGQVLAYQAGSVVSNQLTVWANPSCSSVSGRQVKTRSAREMSAWEWRTSPRRGGAKRGVSWVPMAPFSSSLNRRMLFCWPLAMLRV